MEMTIRLGVESDLPQVTQIYNEAIEERNSTCDLNPFTAEERKQWFKQFSHRNPMFVGEIQGEIACYGCLYRHSPKEGYRYATGHSIYVGRKFRRQGLGKILLQHLINEARNRGYHFLQATIFTTTKPASSCMSSSDLNWLESNPKWPTLTASGAT